MAKNDSPWLKKTLIFCIGGETVKSDKIYKI